LLSECGRMWRVACGGVLWSCLWVRACGMPARGLCKGLT